MRNRSILLYFLFSIFLTSCSLTEKKTNEVLYLNPDLPVEERVEDLLSRMTLREKVGQMNQYVGPDKVSEWFEKRGLNTGDNQSEFYAPIDSIKQRVKRGEIGSFLFVSGPEEANELQSLAKESRLKIPLLIAIDAIHGHAMFPLGGTVYPTSIGLSCTWDTSLVNKITRYTAAELAATGFNWSFFPTVDILRDPRWGRTGETFGEDPFLVAQMTNSVVRGFQDNDPPILACSKGFIGGSQPLNGLNIAPTDISKRTLYEIFLPPYLANINNGVGSIMAAHHEMDGVPMHANYDLLTNLLKKEAGFDGIIISDWMDIFRLNTYHRITKDRKESVEKAVLAGIDIHMHGPGFLEPLLELVKEGRVPMHVIDESVRKILRIKFKFGLFEKQFADVKTWREKVETDEHLKLARESAEKSIVLLKNEDNTLPITGETSRILVTGPNADSHALLGDWSLDKNPEKVITPLEGIKAKAGDSFTIDYYNCGKILDISELQIRKAVEKADKSDIVIVVVGGDALRVEKNIRTYGENVARPSIDLPGKQLELVKALYNTGKKVVVVYITGRPTSDPWIAENIPAIVYAWEPGMRGGVAIGNVLFGDTNPSGKLTVSFPRSAGHIPTWYNHKPSMYTRKYTFDDSDPLFAFGYGLSYSTFTFSKPVLSDTIITESSSIQVETTVTNHGPFKGDETIQLYIRDDYSSITRPVKELKAFRKVPLLPGESATLSFEIDPKLLMVYNQELKPELEKGSFTIFLGTSSRNSDLKSVKIVAK